MSHHKTIYAHVHPAWQVMWPTLSPALYLLTLYWRLSGRGVCFDYPPPPSADVKESVELQLYPFLWDYGLF
jgi:hypothetical protein